MTGAGAHVTVYVAAGCHLCEAALRVLEDTRTETPFELEVVDITARPELERRYRERIPVVALDGEELFTYFVHADKLRQRLDSNVAHREHKVS